MDYFFPDSGSFEAFDRGGVIMQGTESAVKTIVCFAKELGSIST